MLVSMHLDSVKAASTDLIHEVMLALMGYQNDMTEIKETARMRVDRDEYLAQHKAEAKATAAGSIRAAQERFSKSVRHEIDNLRNELCTEAIKRPKALVTDTVRMYYDFAITPTRTEVGYLLDINEGSLLGFQIINATLEKTNAPFRVSYTPLSVYDEDLQKLSYLADHPDGCPQELADVYVDVMPSDNIISTILNIGTFRRTVESIPDMIERWKATSAPTIEDYQEITNPETGEKITPQEQLTAAQKDRDHGTIVSHGGLGTVLGQQKADSIKVSQAALEAHKG